MANKIGVVWVGKSRRGGLAEAADDFQVRLRRFVGVDEKRLKLRGGTDDASRLAQEGQDILGAIPSGALLVALDRRGKEMSSKALSQWLCGVLDTSQKPVYFAIGSDLGLDKAVISRAGKTWSLGRLTLAHEVAQLVLWEQLYRAFTIRHGIKYHREPLQ